MTIRVIKAYIAVYNRHKMVKHIMILNTLAKTRKQKEAKDAALRDTTTQLIHQGSRGTRSDRKGSVGDI